MDARVRSPDKMARPNASLKKYDGGRDEDRDPERRQNVPAGRKARIPHLLAEFLFDVAVTIPLTAIDFRDAHFPIVIGHREVPQRTDIVTLQIRDGSTTSVRKRTPIAATNWPANSTIAPRRRIFFAKRAIPQWLTL